MSITKQVLGEQKGRGRLAKGELWKCIDCGKPIYVFPWQIKSGKKVIRCHHCSAVSHLPKRVKGGTVKGCNHQWVGMFTCMKCGAKVTEIVGNPSICPSCGEGSTFIVAPFKGCNLCGEIRTRPAVEGCS